MRKERFTLEFSALSLNGQGNGAGHVFHHPLFGVARRLGPPEVTTKTSKDFLIRRDDGR
jgi:hypothetical protein